MQNLNWKSYCDREEEGQLFKLEEKGKALFLGTAYPTAESRSGIACTRALEIACDSFLRRPAVTDIAIQTITGFMKEGIYILQEPGKYFQTSAAIVFITRGKARVSAAGDAFVWHLRKGVLEGVFTGEGQEPYGVDINSRDSFPLEFDISTGENSFLLCCGDGLSALRGEFSKKAQGSEMTSEELFDIVTNQLQGLACSAMAVTLPERKKLFG